ncbi:MAG TPA: Ig-like domain repeat protein [Solirubrobacter sp.]
MIAATLLAGALMFVGCSGATAAVAATGPVGKWPGEGDARDSAGTSSGVLNGGTSFAAGVVGQAFSFDGVDDNVTVADAPALNPATQITLDAWVLDGDASVGSDLISKDGELFERQYLLNIINQRFRAHVGVPDDLKVLDGTTVVQTGSWYHAAMTYDGASLKLYVNGALDASMPVSGPIITTSQPVRIGGGAPLGSQLYFKGLIDEPEIFDRALTGDEIKALYLAHSHPTQTTVTSSASNPVWGQPVTWTATVRDTAEPSTRPSGSVRFILDGAPLGAPVPLSSGQASVSAPPLAPGVHGLVVDYTGSTAHGVSRGTLDQAVSKAETAVTESVSPEPAAAGQDAHFNATVRAVAPGAGVPTGSVQFSDDDGTPIDRPGPLDRNGSAAIDAYAGAGDYRVHASYLGDAQFNPSATSVSQHVRKADTATRLTSSQDPVSAGGTLTLRAVVSVVPPGDVWPFGTLQFTVDGVPTGAQIALDDDGAGELTLVAPSVAATTTVAVRYSGDDDTNPSSATIQETVTGHANAIATATPTPAPSPPGEAARLTSLVAKLKHGLVTRGLTGLTATTLRFAASRAGVLVVRVSSRSPGRTLVAIGRISLKGAGERALRLKTTPAGRRLIRQSRALKLTLAASFTPTGATPIVATSRVTARRAG